jgi:hypothetical protein
MTNFAVKLDIESRRTPEHRSHQSVLSPVGEPMGDAEDRSDPVDKERVRHETNIEVGSNY